MVQGNRHMGCKNTSKICYESSLIVSEKKCGLLKKKKKISFWGFTEFSEISAKNVAEWSPAWLEKENRGENICWSWGETN